MMALYCSRCGKQHPDDAIFCMACGSSLKAGSVASQSALIAWEYKDVEIPLNFTVEFKGNLPKTDAGAIGDRLILTYLQREARQGWMAEGVTDFWSLQQLGRVKQEFRHNIWGNMASITYPSARIRLRRPSTK
jgi:hypothetical protein